MKENGFHVVMNVQFGTFAEDPSFYQGNPFETEHSQEWRDAWYKEVEKAILTSADLAEKYGVEMMAPCGELRGGSWLTGCVHQNNSLQALGIPRRFSVGNRR